MLKLVNAESGTGIDCDVVELEELEEPPPVWLLDELWAVDERDELGVVEARVEALLVDAPSEAFVPLTVVEFPVEFEASVPVVLEDSPVLVVALSVLEVPLEPDDVRPDVLCAEVLALEEPWM